MEKQTSTQAHGTNDEMIGDSIIINNIYINQVYYNIVKEKGDTTLSNRKTNSTQLSHTNDKSIESKRTKYFIQLTEPMYEKYPYKIFLYLLEYVGEAENSTLNLPNETNNKRL